MRSAYVSTLTHFARARDGAVAVIFGLSALVLFIAIGITLDASRAYNISNHVQNALDAAALAGARRLSLDEATDNDVRDTSLAYFAAQQSQFKINGAVVTTPVVSIDRPSSSVAMTADISMSSIAGPLSGLLSTIEFTERTSAVYLAKRVELALVLDITGSMCQPNPSPCTSGPKFDGLKSAVQDLVATLSNTTTSSGLVRVGVVPYSAAVNVGAYNNIVAHSPNAGDTCVIERDGAHAFSDAAATGSARIDSTSTSEFGFYACPDAPIIPLTNISNTSDRTALINGVWAMEASGWTAGHLGAAWGWYLLSPNWTSIWPTASDPKPYGNNVIKAVILMTDGVFNTSYRNGGGMFPNDPASTDVNTSGSSPNQTLTLCNNMKAAGLQIYTVAYMAPADAENLLKACGGGSNYYDAANSAQLTSAFQSIAEKLTSLSLKQ